MNGSFDTVSKCYEKVPSYISIGSVYKRMITFAGDVTSVNRGLFSWALCKEVERSGGGDTRACLSNHKRTGSGCKAYGFGLQDVRLMACMRTAYSCKCLDL